MESNRAWLTNEFVVDFEGSGQFPGILDLWGGGGKLVEYRAALFASHGFASLALDYLTCKVTTDTGLVDDEYFEVQFEVDKLELEK